MTFTEIMASVGSYFTTMGTGLTIFMVLKNMKKERDQIEESRKVEEARRMNLLEKVVGDIATITSGMKSMGTDVSTLKTDVSALRDDTSQIKETQKGQRLDIDTTMQRLNQIEKEVARALGQLTVIVGKQDEARLVADKRSQDHSYTER